MKYWFNHNQALTHVNFLVTVALDTWTIWKYNYYFDFAIFWHGYTLSNTIFSWWIYGILQKVQIRTLFNLYQSTYLKAKFSPQNNRSDFVFEDVLA